MASKNEYYELKASLINMVSHTDVVGTKGNVRWRLDKSKFICKTKDGIKNSGAMTPYKPMSVEEARILVNSDLYQTDEII